MVETTQNAPAAVGRPGARHQEVHLMHCPAYARSAH